MKTSLLVFRLVCWAGLSVLAGACHEKKAGPSQRAITELSLKAGQLITCGPANQQLGTVAFDLSCGDETTQDFALGLKLLHSFEYDEAEKVFAAIIHRHPDCAMAYWGVAMSNFHALWTPPSIPELRKGASALALARAIPQKSPKETAYIAALSAFYQDWATVDHRTRCLRFETAMAAVAAQYPTDPEAATFYALALTAAAAPTDTLFTKQMKAGAILTALWPGHPNHPGVVHYLIHAYDAPGLARLALPAARRYAAIAPASAHALHMPSHIFTRLGLWDECIASNLVSVASARCYAEAAGIKGHWDEELHGLDYLVYAYLQQGRNDLAQRQWAYLQTMREVQPASFKVAYAMAAIPARCLLENQRWAEAAALQVPPSNVVWQDFPWQEALIHFTRLLGAVHLNHREAAQTEWQALDRLHQRLVAQQDSYKAQQVQLQMTIGQAWLHFQAGQHAEAVQLMRTAADTEDHTEKHPVTPGEVLPAREQLGDLLLHLKRPEEALAAYEASLQKRPNRFNGLHGAGLAAEQAGHPEKARRYYQQLLAVVGPAGSTRPELKAPRQFLATR